MSVFSVALASQNKASAEGFDWDTPNQAFGKLEEEFLEVKEAFETYPLNHDHLTEEIGDLLLSIVTFSKHMNIDPEQALADAVTKFDRGYAHFKALAEKHDFDIVNSTGEEKTAFWKACKKQA